MPDTFLLLRNNKQTGPFQLAELLQHNLSATDLIWVEGQSVGWQHPTDIRLLKQHLTAAESTAPVADAHPITNFLTTSADTFVPATQRHIYVSLPANAPRDVQPAPAADPIAAKAEALHRRIQAFAQSQPTETEQPDSFIPRSLHDMKAQYGTWQTRSEKKKRQEVLKRRLAAASIILVVATLLFGIYKWMKKEPLQSQAPDTSTTAISVTKAPVTSSEHPLFTDAKDSLELQTAAQVQQNVKRPVRTPESDRNKSSLPVAKSPAETTPVETSATTDTINAQPSAAIEKEPAAQQPEKRAVPLSMLVSAHVFIPQPETGEGRGAAEVVLENKSSELLKTVAVRVTFLKRDGREAGSKTVHFYNVAPNTSPVITLAAHRRAALAQHRIESITRADGSLYLIH